MTVYLVHVILIKITMSVTPDKALIVGLMVGAAERLNFLPRKFIVKG